MMSNYSAAFVALAIALSTYVHWAYGNLLVSHGHPSISWGGAASSPKVPSAIYGRKLLCYRSTIYTTIHDSKNCRISS
ncbi:hypothetical protein GGR55DRAFT_671463 [Xylaria sp. FL0064]|nr:hypothetical protein GGR55DRAFT_671463 [Xylaria sp. FL0064]